MSFQRIKSLPPNNLPISLNTFIGRKQEIAEVHALLSKHRLLTLTGPGGCGKTRLSLQVASEAAVDFVDGIWLAEFASLTEGELISRAVASALDLRERAGTPASKALKNHLTDRIALLVFDNCEHLVDACAQLSADILASCPGVRIMVTSREPLGVQGETVWVVPPLTLPALQPWRSPGNEKETLSVYRQAESIQLFIDRANSAMPGFELTRENGPWVADICRRLDGIPLAIELAAARLRAFSVRQVAERLDDRFRLLTSQLRTVPLRHQTLEATLDWSYALLSEKEQRVLQRLSIFVLGWTLESAEAVCSDDTIEPSEIMGILSNLVDKSLVIVEDIQDWRRYRLLETIREYANQKLAETGKVDSLHERHLDYYADWAERASNYLAGKEQTKWLLRFEVDHGNLRAALDWSKKSGKNARKSLRLAAACGLFWRLHGYLSEGRERLLTALKLADSHKRDEVRAWALLWAANLSYLQSDYAATQELAEEGLQISRQLGEAGNSGVARGLDLLGELATEVGDYESAPGLFKEALEIYREMDEKRGIADMLLQLGWAAMRSGDYAQADTLLHECLGLLRELNESALLGLVLAGLGELAIRRRQFEEAKTLLVESLALRQGLGDLWGIAVSQGSLGWLALLQKDFKRAHELLLESLTLRMEIGDQGGIAWCMEKLAQTVFNQAQALPPSHRRQAYRKAVQIYGSAASLRASIHSMIDPADVRDYEQTLQTLRATLGEKTYEFNWNKGTETSLGKNFILTLVSKAAKSDLLTDSQAAKARFGGLTARERETANLIARGKSNREIAEHMTVRVKTVETYVNRILNKLGFDSRVQIATWTLDVGLEKSDTP